jgi:iron complex outermembrane receptor protein
MEKHMIRDVLKALGFRRFALVAGVGLPLFIGVTARAQQPPAPPAPPPAAAAAPAGTTAEAERVIVTGSNIPTAEEVTAAPVDTLNTQEINRTGSQDILTILQKRNPDFTGGGNLGTSNANIASGSTLGGTVVQIRGFPTLILYEGRRIADSAAIATGTQFADVGLFPAALISRIEVLKDGASALYGSEAIGGVVNIFTKDDFQGAEVGFRYGTALDSAVAERRGYAIGGVGNETTQITAGMQYLERDPLFMRQKAWSNPSFGSGNYGGHVVDFNTGQDFLAIGETPAGTFPGPIIANSPFAVGVVPGSVPAATGFAGIPQFYQPVDAGTGFRFNLSNIPGSTLDESRTNVLVSARHQIFGKQLEIFGNFLYSRSDFQSFLNAQPLSIFTGIVIPPGRPGLTDVTDPAFDPDPLTGNSAIFNPFDEQLDGGVTNPDSPAANLFVANRYNTTNPRQFDNTNNFYRFLGGIRSQITPDWTVEAAVTYSRYDIEYINQNLVLRDQLNAMIAGTAVDGNGNPIPPLDFFAINPIGTAPGQVSKEQFSTIFGSNLRDLTSFQRTFDASLVGFPFELPGGKIGVSFGAAFSQQGFKLVDSPEIFIGSVPVGNIDVKRDTYSVYGELSVPIVGSSMNVPAIYSLELTLAGRFDHYDGVDEDAKVPKVALRYQPIKDLTLRGSFSNSFIAPNLFQTQGPQSSGFSTPLSVNGGTQGQAQVIAGSNPALTPATAQNFSAGFVYSPSFVPGLVITADYFRTLEQNIPSFLGGATILTSADNFGTFTNLVALNNFPGQPGSVAITGPGQVRENINRTFYIDVLQNIGAQHNEGVDVSVHYTHDLRQFGEFEVGVNSIIYTEYEAKVLPTDEYYNLLNTDDAELVGIVPRYKLTFLGEYRWQGFSGSLIANYIPQVYSAVGHSLIFQSYRHFQPIQDYVQFDGRLSYTFVRNELPAAPAPEPKDSKSMRDTKNAAPSPVAGSTLNVFDRMLNGTTVAVGCNNIFDRDPPFIHGANSNTDLSVYDPYGRFLYFEVSKKF